MNGLRYKPFYFKVKCGGVVRRTRLPNVPIPSYRSLERIARKLFKLHDDMNLSMTYTDVEKDVISLEDDMDVQEAWRYQQALGPDREIRVDVGMVPPSSPFPQEVGSFSSAPAAHNSAACSNDHPHLSPSDEGSLPSMVEKQAEITGSLKDKDALFDLLRSELNNVLDSYKGKLEDMAQGRMQPVVQLADALSLRISHKAPCAGPKELFTPSITGAAAKKPEESASLCFSVPDESNKETISGGKRVASNESSVTDANGTNSMEGNSNAPSKSGAGGLEAMVAITAPVPCETPMPISLPEHSSDVSVGKGVPAAVRIIQTPSLVSGSTPPKVILHPTIWPWSAAPSSKQRPFAAGNDVAYVANRTSSNTVEGEASDEPTKACVVGSEPPVAPPMKSPATVPVTDCSSQDLPKNQGAELSKPISCRCAAPAVTQPTRVPKVISLKHRTGFPLGFWNAAPSFKATTAAAPVPATTEQKMAVHPGISCAACTMSPVVGTRCRSSVRPDSDLCSDCDGLVAVGSQEPFHSSAVPDEVACVPDDDVSSSIMRTCPKSPSMEPQTSSTITEGGTGECASQSGGNAAAAAAEPAAPVAAVDSAGEVDSAAASGAVSAVAKAQAAADAMASAAPPACKAKEFALHGTTNVSPTDDPGVSLVDVKPVSPLSCDFEVGDSFSEPRPRSQVGSVTSSGSDSDSDTTYLAEEVVGMGSWVDLAWAEPGVQQQQKSEQQKEQRKEKQMQKKRHQKQLQQQKTKAEQKTKLDQQELPTQTVENKKVPLFVGVRMGPAMTHGIGISSVEAESYPNLAEHACGKGKQQGEVTEAAGVAGRALAPLPPVGVSECTTGELQDVQMEEEKQEEHPADEVLESMLVQMKSMGFTDEALNREALLQSSSGSHADLVAAVEALLGMEKWELLLFQLQEMGFADSPSNKLVMLRNKGNMNWTVHELVHMSPKRDNMN